jgi:hypothetical protein
MSAGLTELGKALGEPAEVEWPAGRVLKFGPVDFDVEMRFSAALQRQAAEGLRRNAPYLGAAHEDAVRAYTDDLACGEFDWLGRVAAKARASVGGTRELVYLCLARNHPDFGRDDLRRLAADAPKWAEVVATLRALLEPPPNGSGPGGSAPPPGRPSGPPT